MKLYLEKMSNLEVDKKIGSIKTYIPFVKKLIQKMKSHPPVDKEIFLKLEELKKFMINPNRNVHLLDSAKSLLEKCTASNLDSSRNYHLKGLSKQNKSSVVKRKLLSRNFQKRCRDRVDEMVTAERLKRHHESQNHRNSLRSFGDNSFQNCTENFINLPAVKDFTSGEFSLTDNLLEINTSIYKSKPNTSSLLNASGTSKLSSIDITKERIVANEKTFRTSSVGGTFHSNISDTCEMGRTVVIDNDCEETNSGHHEAESSLSASAETSTVITRQISNCNSTSLLKEPSSNSSVNAEPHFNAPQFSSANYKGTLNSSLGIIATSNDTFPIQDQAFPLKSFTSLQAESLPPTSINCNIEVPQLPKLRKDSSDDANSLRTESTDLNSNTNINPNVNMHIIHKALTYLTSLNKNSESENVSYQYKDFVGPVEPNLQSNSNLLETFQTKNQNKVVELTNKNVDEREVPEKFISSTVSSLAHGQSTMNLQNKELLDSGHGSSLSTSYSVSPSALCSNYPSTSNSSNFTCSRRESIDDNARPLICSSLLHSQNFEVIDSPTYSDLQNDIEEPQFYSNQRLNASRNSEPNKLPVIHNRISNYEDTLFKPGQKGVAVSQMERLKKIREKNQYISKHPSQGKLSNSNFKNSRSNNTHNQNALDNHVSFAHRPRNPVNPNIDVNSFANHNAEITNDSRSYNKRNLFPRRDASIRDRRINTSIPYSRASNSRAFTHDQSQIQRRFTLDSHVNAGLHVQARVPRNEHPSRSNQRRDHPYNVPLEPSRHYNTFQGYDKDPRLESSNVGAYKKMSHNSGRRTANTFEQRPTRSHNRESLSHPYSNKFRSNTLPAPIPQNLPLANSFLCLAMRGLPNYANSSHIYKFFCRYLIKDLCIELNNANQCNGTAYVQFPTHLSAKDALENENGRKMNDHEIKLNICYVGVLWQVKAENGFQNFEREKYLKIPRRPKRTGNPFYKPMARCQHSARQPYSSISRSPLVSKGNTDDEECIEEEAVEIHSHTDNEECIEEEAVEIHSHTDNEDPALVSHGDEPPLINHDDEPGSVNQNCNDGEECIEEPENDRSLNRKSYSSLCAINIDSSATKKLKKFKISKIKHASLIQDQKCKTVDGIKKSLRPGFERCPNSQAPAKKLKTNNINTPKSKRTLNENKLGKQIRIDSPSSSESENRKKRLSEAKKTRSFPNIIGIPYSDTESDYEDDVSPSKLKESVSKFPEHNLDSNDNENERSVPQIESVSASFEMAENENEAGEKSPVKAAVIKKKRRETTNKIQQFKLKGKKTNPVVVLSPLNIVHSMGSKEKMLLQKTKCRSDRPISPPFSKTLSKVSSSSTTNSGSQEFSRDKNSLDSPLTKIDKVEARNSHNSLSKGNSCKRPLTRSFLRSKCSKNEYFKWSKGYQRKGYPAPDVFLNKVNKKRNQIKLSKDINSNIELNSNMTNTQISSDDNTLDEDDLPDLTI